MKIAYFDCFSGISGDMCLGALVDAGVPLPKLKRELKKIPVKGYRLVSKQVKRADLAATKIDVVCRKGLHNPARTFNDVRKIIRTSSLSPDIKQKGLRIFERIFRVEAKVHGIPLQKVHLHELGAVDCVADIFGTLIGLSLLGIEQVLSSAVNLGSGFVETEHGTLPVPAPATVEILKDVPVYSTGIPYELTTPTGAVIIKELASEFAGMPLMETTTTGIGAGGRDLSRWPNVLRVFIGNLLSRELPGNAPADPSDHTITVIETNIDDMNPQLFEYVMEKLFRAGALDVFLTQILMKKGRPGVKLSALCRNAQRNTLSAIILKETSSIGVRFYEMERIALDRTIKSMDTEFGKIRVKFSRLGGEVLKATPEYEDCKKLARKLGIPLMHIMKKIS
ncbi:MAG: nickel pincer cofactor biosynthesis protein LarC [Thermodesulfovibrionales bacterium]|nr:nickel pincer cofactor biosynthesis protein LarC [Thermodesulfovibrionales bacterium]